MLSIRLLGYGCIISIYLLVPQYLQLSDCYNLSAVKISQIHGVSNLRFASVRKSASSSGLTSSGCSQWGCQGPQLCLHIFASHDTLPNACLQYRQITKHNNRVIKTSTPRGFLTSQLFSEIAIIVGLIVVDRDTNFKQNWKLLGERFNSKDNHCGVTLYFGMSVGLIEEKGYFWPGIKIGNLKSCRRRSAAE